MNLIQKEKEKHQNALKDGGIQVDKEYSRYALYAISDLQKEVRKYFAKKYK